MGGPDADDGSGGSDDRGGSSTSLSGTRGRDIGESRSSSVQPQCIISDVSMYSQLLELPALTVHRQRIKTLT